MKYFNQLYDKLDELPPIIKNFIKTLSKKINKALEYTKDKKIPKTNNLVELLFKVIFSGKIKRIYRTYAGAVTQIKLDDLKWIERMSSKKLVKIKLSVKFFTLTISQSIVENVDKILVYARNNKIYHILYENINYILIYRFKDF